MAYNYLADRTEAVLGFLLRWQVRGGRASDDASELLPTGLGLRTSEGQDPDGSPDNKFASMTAWTDLDSGNG